MSEVEQSAPGGRSAQAGQAASRRPPARFLSGSLSRHLLVVTGTSAIGLMGVFLGELASILFLGLLRDVEVLAAVGYAAALMFFPTSIGIGLSIAATAVVSPAVGAGDMDRAKRLSTHALLFASAVAAVIAFCMWPLLGALLSAMGAAGRTHTLAHEYLRILIPTLPMTAVGMTSMAIMRSLGDAQRAMNVPLAAAGVQFMLEPVAIFLLGLGMFGSALAVSAARIAFIAVGLHGAIRVHGMWQAPTMSGILSDIPLLLRTAVPAVATNVATPVANAFVTAMLAGFGDAAVGAWAIAGRLTPVAFGVVFALSGAVGPIVGQNYGARNFLRVREAYIEAMKINAALCGIAIVGLIVAEPMVIRAFAVSAQTVELVAFYCRFVAPSFLFLGMMFVANAVFNVLGKPHYGTAINWARATIGTVPLVWLGGKLGGAEGALLGSGLGAVAFGLLAAWVGWNTLPPVREDQR
jgi:putative MATE family efflux protein